MADLLTRLIQHEGVSVDYVGRILAALQEDECAPSQRETDPRTAPSPASATAGPAEPLTNRELDILLRLEQRLQTKEIAEELVVSTETVKTHLRHLFRKLEADNRREAVAQARALGILPQR
jgi:LuxR family maltose regulon positive regulatory protein